MKKILLLSAISAVTAGLAGTGTASAEELEFKLTPSAGVTTCLPDARGEVEVESKGPVERMNMRIEKLPPRTEFDVFIFQVPNFPFGLSWYQGDIETSDSGVGKARFIGRFNEETFIVAPDAAAAPLVHDNTFPDAASTPKTGPVHTFHVGVWFNSPGDAAAAGCPDAVTPFNGEHNAGVQVLNTATFPDDQEPLIELKP